MSLSTTARRATFAGSANQGVTDFPFQFPFSLNSHLVVSKIAADGTVTVLVLNTAYSVHGAGSPNGGTVSLIGFTLLATDTLVVERIVPVLQRTDLTNQGAVYPEVVEAAVDEQAQISQQVEDTLGIVTPASARVPKLPPQGVDGVSYYDARNNRISNGADPTLPQDFATKNYADTLVAGVAGGGGAGFITATVTAAGLPTAGAAFLTKVYHVKDTGQPGLLKVCLQLSTGGYDWFVLAQADR